jgi:hypothetical protein
MSLNLNQSAQAILLAQLNADLGQSWTADQIEFGELALNNGSDAASYEVVIQVTGVPGKGPNGSFYYKYNRIDLSAIFNNTNNTYNVDGGIDYAGLIAKINAAIGTAMVLTVLPDHDTNQLYVAGDIMPASMPFPAPGKTSVNFILTADPNSLIYRNSAILVATTAMTSMAAAVGSFAGSTGLTYTAPA